MTSYTADEIFGTSMPVVLASHRIARPATFLSLAPTTSASYPQQQLRTSPPASVISPKIIAADAAPGSDGDTSVAAAVAVAAAAAAAVGTTVAEPAVVAGEQGPDVDGQLTKHRRSSSLASDESGNSKLRFLKLGPVHWGEGDGKGDWSEAGVGE